jgi:hypothetical protein
MENVIEGRRGGLTRVRTLIALMAAALLAFAAFGLPASAETRTDGEPRMHLLQEHRPEDRTADRAERMQRMQEQAHEHDGACTEEDAAERAALREQRMAERTAEGRGGPRGPHGQGA